MKTVTIEMDADTAKLIQEMIDSKLANYTRQFEMRNDKEFDIEYAPDWFHGLVMVEIDLHDALNKKDVA